MKYQEYARHGVEEYWLVDGRDEQISTWRNVAAQFELIARTSPGELVRSMVLPDLDLDPARVFVDLLD